MYHLAEHSMTEDSDILWKVNQVGDIRMEIGTSGQYWLTRKDLEDMLKAIDYFYTLD